MFISSLGGRFHPCFPLASFANYLYSPLVVVTFLVSLSGNTTDGIRNRNQHLDKWTRLRPENLSIFHINVSLGKLAILY